MFSQNQISNVLQTEINSVEEQMGKCFEKFLSFQYTRTLACAYAYFHKIQPDEAEKTLSHMEEPLRSIVEKLSEELSFNSPEVLGTAAFILENSDFNSPDILQGIKNAEKETAPAEYEKFLLDLMDNNPLLSVILREYFFLFSDFKKLSKREIDKIIRETDSLNLKIALVGADKEIQEIFFSRMSKRAVVIAKEDIEYLERKLADSKETIIKAQRNLCDKARQLIFTGFIEMPYDSGVIYDFM